MSNSETQWVKKGQFIDPFEIFGLHKNYNIDLEILEKKYLEYQKICHPDQFSQADSREKLLAQKKSADINDAYFLLKDPIKRADYLVQYFGHESLISENTTISDPQLLMQMLMLQEQMSEIENLQKLRDFESQIIDLVRQCEDELSEAFHSQIFSEAQKMTLRLQYYTKLKKELLDKKRLLKKNIQSSK